MTILMKGNVYGVGGVSRDMPSFACFLGINVSITQEDNTHTAPLYRPEPDNENGITPQTLSISNTLWERSEQQWNNEDYLTAMKGFQSSLEIYKLAWPYIGKSSGSNDRVKDSDVNDFCDKSFMLAKKLLFCSYCELDANQGEILNGHYTMIVLYSKSQRCNEAHAFNIAQLYFPTCIYQIAQIHLLLQQQNSG